MAGRKPPTNHTRARLERALIFIDKAKTERLTIERIAGEASLSPFHFQRLFVAHMGETVGGYVASRRLDEAVRLMLAEPNCKIIDVALHCGFETHSAFSRAFRQQFDCAPSRFRRQPQAFMHRATPSRKKLLPQGRDGDIAQPQIKALPQSNALFRQFRGTRDGSFFGGSRAVSQTEFDQLMDEAGARLRAVIGGFPQAPDQLNDPTVCGYFGGLMEAEYASSWSDIWLRVDAGRWAIFPHFGSYKYLYQSWNRIYRSRVVTADLALRDAWPYEAYVNDPDVVDRDMPTALIHIPII